MKNKTFLKSRHANLFLANRAVFLDGGPEKKAENYKNNDFAIALEANARSGKVTDGKPKVEQKEPISSEELKRKSLGYPEITVDSKVKSIIDEIKARHAAKQKAAGKTEEWHVMMHGDSGNFTGEDSHDYALVIDANHNPQERLFRSNEKKAAPPTQKEAIDLDDAVGSLIQPSNNELKTDDKEYTTTVAQLKSQVKNHGDSVMTGIVKGNEKIGWVLLRDDLAKDQGGLRVFKGTPVEVKKK